MCSHFMAVVLSLALMLFRIITEPKSGECPKFVADELASCANECHEDVDCRGDAKCCYNGCGMMCVVPYVPGKDAQVEL